MIAQTHSAHTHTYFTNNKQKTIAENVAACVPYRSEAQARNRFVVVVAHNTVRTVIGTERKQSDTHIRTRGYGGAVRTIFDVLRERTSSVC